MNSRVYTTLQKTEPEDAAGFQPLRTLDAVPELPAFPVDTLPGPLADYACEIAETVQCPVDLPAVATLAACATAVQRVAMVAVGETHREPLNLWTLSAADPSERKSETFGKVFFPVYQEQAELARRMAAEVERAQQNHRLQTMRIQTLEKNYSRAKPNQLDELQHDIEQARAQLQEPPSIPRFTASDCTPETLATILCQNGGRLSVIDAEGAGPLANALGRYSDTGTKLENLLRSYRGDPMQIDRRGRHETIFAPHLTLALALQPGVLRGMGKHPEARQQGFTARFLYSIPNTKAGTRLYTDRRINRSAAEVYKNALTRLLQLPAVAMVDELPELPELTLTGAGLDVWREYHDATEKAMRDGGPLAGCRDFAGKLAGHGARLAGILAMVQRGADAIGRPIPAGAVESACGMMRDYFQPHGLAAYAAMFERGEGSLPARVVEWIARHRGDAERFPIFSQARLFDDLRRGEGVNDSADLAEPLQLLTERGYIRELPTETSGGPGRPASRKYEVNPAL